MFYDGVQDLYKEKVYNIPINGSSITVRTGHIITEKAIKANLLLPCWSLAALLDVIPGGQVNRMANSNKWEASYWNDSDFEPAYYVEDYDNPVDACVAMIEKLHELKML